ncbi:asparagine synthetase B family protein [Photorhabdus tasmaniensis]|uniref:asparagine synthase (glutamine-hydrolyzing) n=1 Tax=Photorhabdus tasmaniensis TaxID=1004159 RepID=A0ABX0GIW6_9GAMM|nr:asparagine synthase-related protein [Photorhabdus tasmaniensis]NHB89164.1 hypothetical protein [Photorhabdus tasmaniensis]
MGGITGIFSQNTLQQSNEAIIAAMTDLIMNRGPDFRDIYYGKNFAVGQTAVKTCRMQQTPCEPISYDHNGIMVVIDGKIDNSEQLRHELKQIGYHFSGESDSELIQKMYAEHCESFCEKIDGSYALAIHDRSSGCLILARDRLAEKPLYYMIVNDCVYFSSTPLALMATPDFNFEVSAMGLIQYLAYTQCPPPETIFANIYKIPAAHLVIFNGIQSKSICYWKVKYLPRQDINYTDAVEQLHEILSERAKLLFDIDVPFGILLSGGVDSSVSLGLACNTTGSAIETYTLTGSNLGKIDIEQTRADIISKLYKTKQHVYSFANMNFSDFSRVIQNYPEPIGLVDSIHVALLSEMIRNDGIKIIFSGNGADEIFFGYTSYLNLLEECSALSGLDIMHQKSLLREQHYKMQMLSCQYLKESVSSKLSKCLVINDFYFDIFESEDIFETQVFLDFMLTLNHSASFFESTSVNYGVEHQSIYLNQKCLEFSASLPRNFKIDIHGNLTKKILKSIAENYMPKYIIYNRKLGCGSGIDYKSIFSYYWNDEIRSLFHSVLHQYSTIFEYDSIEKLMNKVLLRISSNDEYLTFVKLLILFCWLDGIPNIQTKVNRVVKKYMNK